MKKLMIITLTAGLVFGVACGKADDAVDNDEPANGEKTTDRISEEPGDESEKEQPELIYLAEKLNVRAKPGTASEVVGAISRGESISLIGENRGEYLPDDPSGYTDWYNVRLSDGTEGWVARMFVIDYEVFKQLEEVDLAAKSGDSAKTEAAISALIGGAGETEYFFEGEYSRSADGKLFVVANDTSSFNFEGFMITVGYGVSSHAPLDKYSIGRWLSGSRYCTSYGLLAVYDCNSMKAVFVADMFIGCGILKKPEIIIWEGLIELDEIEYPLVDGPVTAPDNSGFVADHYSGYICCLEVYDLATGESYLAAAPDLTTWPEEKNWSGNGYIWEAIWKPTERFAATPFFGPVSETGIYKNHVGKLRRFDPSQE